MQTIYPSRHFLYSFSPICNNTYIYSSRSSSCSLNLVSLHLLAGSTLSRHFPCSLNTKEKGMMYTSTPSRHFIYSFNKLRFAMGMVASTLVDIFFIASTGCTRRTLQFIYLSRHFPFSFSSINFVDIILFILVDILPTASICISINLR